MLNEVKRLGPVGDVASGVKTHLSLPGQVPSEDSEPALNAAEGAGSSLSLRTTNTSAPIEVESAGSPDPIRSTGIEQKA